MSKSKKKKAAKKRKKQEKKKRSTVSDTLQVGSKTLPCSKQNIVDDETDTVIHFRPYDENLLECARTQWQFGDWQSLASIDRETLQHHPDRAKLALLTAAGHLHINDLSAAKEFVNLAQHWGCSKQLVSRVLISGVHNSLGRAAALAGRQSKAQDLFEKAVAIGTPGGDIGLLSQARINEQYNQLGLVAIHPYPQIVITPQVSVPVESTSSFLAEIHNGWEVGNWLKLSKLDNADLVHSKDRAELALYAAAGYQQLEDVDGLQRCTRLALEWGCQRDKISAMLAAGIRNTLAISETLASQYQAAARNFKLSITVGGLAPTEQSIKARIKRQLKTLKGLDLDKVFDLIVKHLG